MASVAIIIPIRNRAEYLPRLFRSLAAVNYEELEIILVDNASTDDSLSLCHSFAEDAPMVVRVVEEPVPGASRARNCGLANCQSEWVYFFDSDDELSPGFLTELMPLAEEADMICFPTLQTVGNHTAQRAFVQSVEPSAQLLSSTLNTQGMLFRTSFLREIGGWDATLSIWDDWELGFRALQHHPRMMWKDDKAYHHVYVHAESLTGPSYAARREEIEEVLKKVSQELKSSRERRALYFRCCIVNGQLRREGGTPIPIPVSSGFPVRLIGCLLQYYVRLGGRGAWRLALALC